MTTGKSSQFLPIKKLRQVEKINSHRVPFTDISFKKRSVNYILLSIHDITEEWINCHCLNLSVENVPNLFVFNFFLIKISRQTCSSSEHTT